VEDKHALLQERLYVEEGGDKVLTVGLKNLVNPDEDKLILNTLVRCLIERLESQESQRRVARSDSLKKLQNSLSRGIEGLQRELKVNTQGDRGVVAGSSHSHQLQMVQDTKKHLYLARVTARIALASLKARAKAPNKAPESDPKVVEE